MRTPREISYRLRQEAVNLAMFLKPPAGGVTDKLDTSRLGAAGEIAARLRGTAFASEIERLAETICRHEIPLLGLELQVGDAIRWRRDYVNGVESGLDYFRRIPYLDVRRSGDHKFVWELNRHQHLVVLAQAWSLTGRAEFRRELAEQLRNWLRENPFLRGINWTSALEVAFRALSWIWIEHLAGGELEGELHRQFLDSLYRHGCYLEANLSVYFSPNTHLLGEAVALHALGVVAPEWPRAEPWRETGARLVTEQLARQVRADGSHFEQSAYYHVYALDFLLLHAVFRDVDETYRSQIGKMADFLNALMGTERRLPMIGDDDGGRVLHPFGARAEFGRATLATCAVILGRDDLAWEEADLHPQAAWWIGERAFEARPSGTRAGRASELYPSSGLAVMAGDGVSVVVDAGEFGEGNAGHSHSDTLSLVVTAGERELLIDPGTYTYVGDGDWRDYFRGSSAHNTIRVDGRDQAKGRGPFRWTDKPEVRLRKWETGPAEDYLDACWTSAGITHRRRLVFRKPDLLVVIDDVEGPPGEHLVEQFWHLGGTVKPVSAVVFQIGPSRLIVPSGGAAELFEGWRSNVMGTKQASPVIRWWKRAPLPLRLAAALDLAGNIERVDVEESGGRVGWNTGSASGVCET